MERHGTMQKVNMQIEKMTSEHLNEVCDIEINSFTHPWSRDSINAEIQNNNTIKYVAIENEKVVGYILLNYVLDEGYLLNVAIDHSFRNQGVATMLFEKIFQEALNMKLSFITLEVRNANIAAINLYKKLGFNEVSRRKDYYHNPVEDAILMTKKFEV